MQAAANDRPLLRLLPALTGLVAWGAQFTVIYMTLSVICTRGKATTTVWGFGLAELVVGAATLAAALVSTAALVWSLHRLRPQAACSIRFLDTMTRLVSGIALLAIFWQGLPALIVPPCW